MRSIRTARIESLEVSLYSDIKENTIGKTVGEIEIDGYRPAGGSLAQSG